MFFSFEKRKNELILVKPIRKSNFLKNLEKQRYEGLRRVEKGKAEILVDKILKKDQIYRDYSIFTHKNNDMNEEKLIIENNKGENNENIKNNKTPKKYNVYNTPKYYHKNNIISNKKSKESKDMFITGSNGYKNILSIIGDDIIKSNDYRKYGKNRK